jgi:hypothetical protein
MSSTILWNQVNSLVSISNVFEVNGTPTDPTTVSVIVTDPTGSTTTYTYSPGPITRSSAGSYALNVTCSPSVVGSYGLWNFVWIGTGTASDASHGTFRTFALSDAITGANSWYCGLEELKARLSITNDNFDYEATMAIQTATDWITRYCVVPETPILTADLRWVPAGTLCEGDELVGVDEYAPESEKRGKRHYRKATVTAAPRRMAPCTKIVLEDGREVISAANHRWLARSNYGKSGSVYDWTIACTIQPGYEISAPFTPWPEETSFEAGWTSGIFDGEGWIHTGKSGVRGSTVGVAQNPGPVLSRIEHYLKESGIPYTYVDKQKCKKLEIQSRAASMELLGRLQPLRLMPRNSEVWEGGQVTGSCRVVSVESAGVREVVSLGTSTGTYIANGLTSHNCGQHFYQVTEARGFYPYDLFEIQIDPLVSATAVNLSFQGAMSGGQPVYDTTWGDDMYILYVNAQDFNANTLGIPRPYSRIQVAGSPGPISIFPVWWPFTPRQRIQIVGTWGWPVVPPDVVQAALFLATDIYKSKDAPWGIVGSGDFAGARVQSNPMVVEMLRPYIRGAGKKWGV